MKEEEALKFYDVILKHVEKTIKKNTITTSLDLIKLGKHFLGDKFHGVYSRDQFPSLTRKKSYAILNLDTSDKPGSHWVAVVYKNKEKFVVYDSFGRDMNKYFNKNVVNPDRDVEQTKSETNCGQRSIAFLVFADMYGLENALLI